MHFREKRVNNRLDAVGATGAGNFIRIVRAGQVEELQFRQRFGEQGKGVNQQPVQTGGTLTAAGD